MRCHGVYRSRLKTRLAMPAFRRPCTRMSSTTPCCSTARQRSCGLPPVRRRTSLRCQVSPGLGLRRAPGREVGVTCRFVQNPTLSPTGEVRGDDA